MTTLHPLIIIGVTLAVSLIGLLGGFIVLWRERAIKKWTKYLISFAAGSILGAAFLELFPEAIDATGDNHTLTPLLILVGILVFFTLEKLLVLHHHTHGEALEHNHKHHQDASLVSARPLIIIGDALHNLLDGVIIAAAFSASTPIGIATAIAVVAHEIPQEIGDFSILLHSGMEKSRVVMWNLIGAFISPVGTVIGLVAFQSYVRLEAAMICIALGGFIYIALADLVPSIKHGQRFNRSMLQLAFVLLGVAVVYVVGIAVPEG